MAIFSFYLIYGMLQTKGDLSQTKGALSQTKGALSQMRCTLSWAVGASGIE